MKLGIYGGTFSPPHKGHIEAAEAFVREIGLDKLLIIPTFIPPHKAAEEASPEDRLNMCRIAFSNIPNTEISDMEIKRGGKSYTYLTLEELKDDDTELFFLCGTDMILTFDLWKRYEYIFSLATICYARRENDKEISLKIEEKIEQYKKLGANILEIKHEVTEVSSTDIREASDSLYNEFLTPEVAGYIKDFGLYKRNYSEDELFDLRESVKELMSEKRFLHTLGVESAAAKIAEYVAPNITSRIRAAAILHDVTKEMSQEELIRDFYISVTDEDSAAYETLHAITAPHYIFAYFPHFAASDILFAVETHTVGDPKISTIGKIIFVADYIEEGRKYESCHALRKRLYSELEASLSKEEALEALDRAVISSIDHVSAHLLAINKQPHTKTSLLRDAISKTRGKIYGN